MKKITLQDSDIQMKKTISTYIDLERAVSAFKQNIQSENLAEYQANHLGRDEIVKYCSENEIEVLCETYPSPLITTSYKQYTANQENDNCPAEDYDEFHNSKFVTAFSEALTKLHYTTIIVYYGGFDEAPGIRCYQVKISDLFNFLGGSEIPVHFLDDTFFFSPDFKYGLCIFHHEWLEFFSFGGDPYALFRLTSEAISKKTKRRTKGE